MDGWRASRAYGSGQRPDAHPRRRGRRARSTRASRVEVTVVLRRRAPLPAGGRAEPGRAGRAVRRRPGRRRAGPVRGRGRRRRGGAGRPGVPAGAGRRPGRGAGRAVRRPSCSGSASRTGSWSGSAPARCQRAGRAGRRAWSPCSGWTTARRRAARFRSPAPAAVDAATRRCSSARRTRCRPAPTAPAATLAIIELGGGFAQADLRHLLRRHRAADAARCTAVGVDGAANAPERRPARRRRRGAARHRGRRRARPGRRHRGLLRAQHRRRLPRRGQRGRARRPDAGRDQHQLGAERGRVDRAGPHRDGRGVRRRRRARRRR